MQTRDGCRLDADLYRPEAPGEFPVLLMRQPYGRAIASTVVYAHPRWYAAQGYLVVIQDVRGRGSSEGEFHLFATEVEDGEETVNWAAGLPGSSGVVGMYGFSYQGMTQLYAASRRPTALRALCPAMLAYDLYHDWAYEGGAFCLQAGLAWAIQLAAQTAHRAGREADYLELAAAAAQLPLQDALPSQPDLLRRLAPDSFYHDWVERTDPGDRYWQSRVPNLTDVDLPMLHIGGWFDPYLRGSLKLFERVASDRSPLQMASPQQLWVGPWGHLPWGRRVGALDFGPEAVSPVDQLQLRWFDQFLKGQDHGLVEAAPVHLFEMGSNRWRSFEGWPPPPQPLAAGPTGLTSPLSLALVSNGLANLRDDAGQLLQLDAGAAFGPGAGSTSSSASISPSAPTATLDLIVHDPWRPCPALGGHAAFPNGPFERSAIDSRSDVATYRSAPLEADLHLAGAIALLLHCSSEAPSFDLCAVLAEVRPEGVFNFSQGYLRISRQTQQLPGQPCRIDLQPSCIRIPRGHRLCLSLSAACFPAYGVNPGTGQDPNVAAQFDQQVITLAIASGGDRPAQLLLPVVAPALDA